MIRGARQTAAVLALAAAVMAAAAGCWREPDVSVMRRAWQHSSDRQVDEAIPLVKSYLLWHPEDAAAHYVLGACYLHRPDANTTIAKGEFETALYCFGRHHDLGVLAPGMTPEQFQSAAHRDIALALMRALYEGEKEGVPGSAMFPMLGLALRHVQEGLRFDPSSEYLKEMERSLEDLRRGRPAPPPPPSPPGTPGEITT